MKAEQNWNITDPCQKCYNNKVCDRDICSRGFRLFTNKT